MPGRAPALSVLAPALVSVAAMLLARLSGQPALALPVVLPALAIATLRQQPRPLRLGLAIGGGAAGSALAAWPDPFPIPALLMPLGDLLLCVHFAATLRPGREPLITRYTRHDFGHLPPECAAYAGRLTMLWAALFGVLAPLHLGLLLGLPPLPRLDSGLVLGASLGFMLALFLGEHVIRNLRFPQHGVATPTRTVRAILSAHLSRHA